MNITPILEDIRRGIPIILVDDKMREDEADIVLAAEYANETNIVFCMNNARGLMCIPTCGTILDRLQLPPMVELSTDKNNTPFTVSVDAAVDTTTGMSVSDRLKTIKVFTDVNSKPSDLNRPGHLFPLRPRSNLLKDRRGHTEGSIELMRLAKCMPVSIIVEIINDDGTMARGDNILTFAEKHNLKVVSVQDIYEAVYGESL